MFISFFGGEITFLPPTTIRIKKIVVIIITVVLLSLDEDGAGFISFLPGLEKDLKKE